MKPIVFFDSGIGGLTVLYEAMNLMPNEDYIYFSDGNNIPYGTKSTEEIRLLVNKAISFLSELDPKVLVLACNTATSVVVNELRNKYHFPILGMEPAIKPAAKVSDTKRILLTATLMTLKEEKLENLIIGLGVGNRVEKLSLQELVLFAEKKEFDSMQVADYLKVQLSNFEWEQFSSLVLGCTHFIFYKHIIRSLIPASVQILDGNSGTVRHLKDSIVDSNFSKNNRRSFYVSGRKCNFELLKPYFEFLETIDNGKV